MTLSRTCHILIHFTKSKKPQYSLNQTDVYQTLLLFLGGWAPLLSLIHPHLFHPISHSQHGVMLQRRRDGVKPDMPTAQEREQIRTALGGRPY